ncbi:MAG: GTP-binding protein, partial [Pseudomonadota bacterium]
MFVLGTAGHVDHGKSSLLRALTGMEPDRLPEEKARGLTINLGFLWSDFADVGRVGFVDVPGHHRFLGNMISGASELSAFILVVACDDGWMPQTEEHLQILKSFGISRGICVLTKTDLVSSEQIKALQEEVISRVEQALSFRPKV